MTWTGAIGDGFGSFFNRNAIFDVQSGASASAATDAGASGFTVRSSALETQRSGIVACEVSDDERKRIQSTARAGGVILNFREGLMRFSPHAYTNSEDLERLRLVLTKNEI